MRRFILGVGRVGVIEFLSRTILDSASLGALKGSFSDGTTHLLDIESTLQDVIVFIYFSTCMLLGETIEGLVVRDKVAPMPRLRSLP